MGAKQLSFLSEVDEKTVQTTVINILKDYRALKVAMKNKEEQEAAGVVCLFPSFLTPEEERRNEMKVRQIDRALQHSLDHIERQIIERKYLSEVEVKDIDIYLDLNIKKDPYYEKKRRAISRIAQALRIV